MQAQGAGDCNILKKLAIVAKKGRGGERTKSGEKDRKEKRNKQTWGSMHRSTMWEGRQAVNCGSAKHAASRRDGETDSQGDRRGVKGLTLVWEKSSQ